MKKIFLYSLAAMTALALGTSSLFAGDADGAKKKAAGSTGVVQSVSGDSITIKTKEDGEKTFQISSAKVQKEDKSAGSVSDIKAGERVRIKTGDSESEATMVKILPAKKAGEKKDADRADGGQ